MSKKTLGEAKDIQVDTLSDEDLESVAGGAIGETDMTTECGCPPTRPTDDCDIDEQPM